MKNEDVTERFTGYATARSDRQATLAAEVASTVLELVNDVRAGSRVSKGQLLVRLDDREYQRQLDRALSLASADQASVDQLAVEEANLEQLVKTAEQELRVAYDEKMRVTGLFESDWAAKKEYDFANLAYQQARRVLQSYQREVASIAPRQERSAASKRSHEASADLARLNIERCGIRAPFAGTIEDLMVDVGDRVGPGSVVMTLIDPSVVEIAVRLPAAVYDRVEVGAACRVECESMPGVAWSGEVARVAPSVDDQTRTFASYVRVDNTRQDRPLVPGTFVRAAIDGPTYTDCLLVPRGAIRAGHIFVVEEGISRRRTVQVERLILDRAVVSGELRAGERVILSQPGDLEDGTRVRVREALSASGSTGSGPGQSGTGQEP